MVTGPGTWLAVAVGGALGALARYAVALWIPPRVDGGFPWATLSVNVVGSAILGLAVVTTVSGRLGPPWLAAGLATGFCGAMTTFSTFAFETVTLARLGYYAVAALCVAANFVLCLAVVAFLMRLLPRP